MSYDAVTTWVDRLSRRVHFIPCVVSDTAKECAKILFLTMFVQQGLPDSIVSYQDPKFTSKFWSELINLCDICTKMSASHHSQSNGLSEIMNRMLEIYIQCYCALNQRNWDKLLPAAGFAYNSPVFEDLGMSQFEVDIG